MAKREDPLEHASNLIEDAAIGLVEWPEAMRAFAGAVGTRTGQLIGIGASETLPFNVLTEMNEDAAAEFALAGGGNPVVNSRVRVGSQAPQLSLRDDADFTIAADNACHPEFAEWQRRHRVGYTCLTNLLKNDRYLIGCAAIQEAGRDGMGTRDKARFAALASVLRRAVRLQLTIEGQQARYVSRSFDMLNRAAFVCGADGHVVALSRHAEDLARSARWLALRNNRLRLHDHAADQRLRRAIASLAADQLSLGAFEDSIVAFDAAGSPLVLECARLADSNRVSMLAQVVVIAHQRREQGTRLFGIVQTAYGLTPAEATVACHICVGLGPAAIAQRCGITAGTVRTHLKRIFSKTGTRSQVELAARLVALN